MVVGAPVDLGAVMSKASLVMRIVTLDAQGREKLRRLVLRTNARFRQIEEEYAERSGGEDLTLPGVRIIAIPASNKQITEARAAKTRKRGQPPL
jgi:hypothetical protein